MGAAGPEKVSKGGGGVRNRDDDDNDDDDGFLSCFKYLEGKKYKI